MQEEMMDYDWISVKKYLQIITVIFITVSAVFWGEV